MDEALLVREMVLLCERCELFSQCGAPVPFAGPAPARVAIVGEAPGAEEDKKGAPFVGPSGRLLRDHLLDVDIDPRGVFICNTVSCFPHGTPTAEQVDACLVNKLAQLDLASPGLILLLGAVALGGFRPDLQIGKARGRPFWLPEQNAVAMATYHPAAALRNRLYEKGIHEDLVRFARLVELYPEWTSMIPDSCVECASAAWWFDDTGIGWCEQHMPPEGQAHLASLSDDLEKTRKGASGASDLRDGS